MPRRQHEKDRPAPTGARTGRDRATADRITDSGLGMLPSAERRQNDATDVIGPDRDDARLRLEPGGLPPELTYQEDAVASRRAAPDREEVIAEEPDLTTTPHSIGGDDGESAVPNVEPSLMDQDTLTDPMAAMGAPDDLADPAADGDEAYVPPTDPVITNDGPGGVAVLGGFATSSSEGGRPARSASDGRIGDEALADAVRDALTRDAATTDLDILVAVRQGVVRLHGTVADLDDAENAEDVARRVEGVVDVVEELTVATL